MKCCSALVWLSQFRRGDDWGCDFCVACSLRISFVSCVQISIITEIAQNALLLSKHPYGNYVVQHLLGKKHRGIRVATFPGMLEAVSEVRGRVPIEWG